MIYIRFHWMRHRQHRVLIQARMWFANFQNSAIDCEHAAEQIQKSLRSEWDEFNTL